MEPNSHFNWKILDMGTNDNYMTHIAKVPTGWLVKETILDNGTEVKKSSSLIHIPDIDHETQVAWEGLVNDEGFYEYEEIYKYVKKEREKRKKLIDD